MTDRITLYREPALPYVELVLMPAHPLVVLGANSKPKRTDKTVPAQVRVSTGPCHDVVTASPDRLRVIAQELLTAADTLQRALTGEYPFPGISGSVRP